MSQARRARRALWPAAMSEPVPTDLEAGEEEDEGEEYSYSEGEESEEGDPLEPLETLDGNRPGIVRKYVVPLFTWWVRPLKRVLRIDPTSGPSSPKSADYFAAAAAAANATSLEQVVVNDTPASCDTSRGLVPLSLPGRVGERRTPPPPPPLLPPPPPPSGGGGGISSFLAAATPVSLAPPAVAVPAAGAPSALAAAAPSAPAADDDPFTVR